MFLFQDALVQYPELIAEHGWSETLAPDLRIHQFNELRRKVGVFERAVSFDHAFQLVLRKPGFSHGFKCRLECIESLGTYRQAGGHRMAAEFVDDGRRMLGYQVERI